MPKVACACSNCEYNRSFIFGRANGQAMKLNCLDDKATIRVVGRWDNYDKQDLKSDPNFFTNRKI